MAELKKISGAGASSYTNTMRRMGVLPPILIGLGTVAVFVGGFGAWATFVPLESAAIAPGVISVQSHRKVIQHLEGGIIAEILVDEGSIVEAGETVIRLDTTQAQIRYELSRNRLQALSARAARLEAERSDLAEIIFPDWLLTDARSPQVERILAQEREVLSTRLATTASQNSILAQRILQLEEEIAGFENEIDAQERQLSLILEETETVQWLVDQGLGTMPRLLALFREAAEIEGDRARNRALIARAQQRIGETRLQVDGLGAQRDAELAEELREAEIDMTDIRERMAAAEDILARTDINTLHAGTVVDLQVFTPGGVISGGQILMEIVPLDDPLIVEAKIAPNDIDVVQPGQEATAYLSAFSRRSTPGFTGHVIQVSADLLVDDRTGAAHYLARIELDENQEGLEGIRLHPGMQAEVMIKTGERTLLQYILEPLTVAMSRALRED